MSNPPLPPEILDYIVDLLHDDSNPLKECCLVSKCWIPRTRKHLFAHIKLKTAADLESWKETFPDPSTSPAHHTNTLSVGCPHLITPADADGWIRGFSRVVKLELVTSSRTTDESMISFIPLHGFSPVIESLHVRFGFVPPSRIFSLILSFPLLGDLTLVSCCTPTNSSNGPDGLPTVVQPSNSPAFTGSLDLYLEGGTMLIARRLLALPGGLRFQKFTSTWCDEEGLLLTTAVVEECSYTLEFLDIICYLLGRRFHTISTPTSVTPVSSWGGVTSDRSLEGDNAKKCGLLDIRDRMDHHGTSNHHTQSSRTSTSLDLCG